jgi:hypothetical protein
MVGGELGGGMGEEEAHQGGIDPGEDQRGHAAIVGADGDVGVDELPHDLVADRWAQGQRRPTSPAIVQAAKPTLILEEQAYRP